MSNKLIELSLQDAQLIKAVLTWMIVHHEHPGGYSKDDMRDMLNRWPGIMMMGWPVKLDDSILGEDRDV